jgi:hypothetical protein
MTDGPSVRDPDGLNASKMLAVPFFSKEMTYDA